MRTSAPSAVTVNQSLALDSAFRLLLKVRVSRVPAASTAALASLAGPAVELFDDRRDAVFSPVVKLATSFLSSPSSARASRPAADRS